MIYFCTEHSVEDGPVKIGVTKASLTDPEWRHALAYRLSGLQTGNPRALEAVAAMDGGSAEERELHTRFAAAWVLGEWFLRVPEVAALLHAHRIEPVRSLGVADRDTPIPAVAAAVPASRVEGFVTAEIVERELGFPRGLLGRMRARGDGPPCVHPTKGLYLYRREDVDAWILSRRIDPEERTSLDEGARVLAMMIKSEGSE